MGEQNDELQSNSDTSDTDSISGAGTQSMGMDVFPVSDHDAKRMLPLLDWELASAWRLLKRKQLPKTDIAKRLLQGVADIYYNSSSLVHLERPMVGQKFIIVGDL